MEHNELDNKLTAWWLDIAPARQEELISQPETPKPWLDESIAEAGLDVADVQRFVEDKRRDPVVTRDAGGNPKPN